MAENTFFTPPASQQPEPPKEPAKKSKAKARKKESPKKSGPSFFSKIKSLKDDKQLRLGIGITLLLSGIYLAFALVSFLFTGRADQSVMESYFQNGVLQSGREIENWLGALGAGISHFLMYRTVGLGAYLIPYLIFISGIQLTFSNVNLPIRRSAKFVLFTSIWLSTFFSFCLIMAKSRGYSGYWSFIGGGIGHEIALIFNDLFSWGTLIILLIILGFFIIYFFDIKEAFQLPQFSAPSILKKKENSLPSEDTSDNEFFTSEDPLASEEDLTENVQSAVKTPPQEEKPANKVNFSINKPIPESPVAKEELPQKKTSTQPLPETATPQEEEVTPPVLKPQSSANRILIPDEEEFSLPQTPLEAPVAEEIRPKPSAAAENKPMTEVKEEEEPKLSLSVDIAEVDDKAEDEEEESANKELVMEPYDPTLDLGSYQYPQADLLKDYPANNAEISEEELNANFERIVETLENFKITISDIKATVGPTVTLYEIVPAKGIKISKIKNLEDDIALSLSALGIRIIAPIPGRGTIGIEVPNTNKEMVSMKSVLNTEKFLKSNKALPVVIGKTISNEVYVFDLAKTPHLLIAGATGQGKSVGLNAVLTSLLYKKHPSELKLILVDPKKVELTLYNKIERHFLAKLPDGDDAIITDTKKVVHTLNSLCIEMDNRYDMLKNAGCRNIKEYNAKFIDRKLNPLDGHRHLPYIVLVIDELADLMMTAGKEVETPIARLAQLARAIGIHLVVATQRPSVNVITGIIKANFPARLSFKVTSKVDSRTILDTGGAEQLIGRGDMLLSDGNELTRLQCAFVDTPEVDNVCDFIGNQRGYSSAYLLPEYVGEEGESAAAGVDLSERDALFEEAAYMVVRNQSGSTSLIQRKLKLGYNRAGRIIDQLEAAGIVGPPEGSKAREVLVSDEYALEQMLNDL
ncbi:DNA translocase FtsK [Persicobacter sp. CCB-QB2]|uniref:DNA translocase FtsK n=1 Tax=Persicobacter sp. CCB-QB2 TaxID=1561025 RepID=UPI0006A95FBE|nr:DNA translocase FtsK [Persicobacter sp. CCB-QB2]